MTEAEAFVQNWSKVWRGRDSDAHLYMELLHEGCPLINPINPITREDLPAFVEAVLEQNPTSASSRPAGPARTAASS